MKAYRSESTFKPAICRGPYVAEFSIGGADYEAELHPSAPAAVHIGLVSKRVRDARGNVIEYEWRTVMNGAWCSRKRVVIGDGDPALVAEATRKLREALGRSAD